jgi:putative endonuclease
VYILSNYNHSTLYVGITNDLIRRVYEHRQDLVEGFTKKYRVHELMLYEEYSDPVTAIEREKQIKSWSRKRKDELILQFNPYQADLCNNLM